VYRLIQAITLPILILGVASTQAQADIAFPVTMPSSGTTATVGFTITSNDSSTLLSDFNLGLNISPSPTSQSTPFFSVNQPDQYVGGDGLNYVFAGVSLGSGSPFWSDTSSGVATNITGGDIASTPVTVSSTGAYLATVQFEVAAGSDPGQTFLLTLFSAGSPVIPPGASPTEFDDQNGMPLSYTASFTQSAGGGGTVNINISTATVPEPSSLAMAVISGLGGLLVYRRSRR
jgi:hypothetical protein